MHHIMHLSILATILLASFTFALPLTPASPLLLANSTQLDSTARLNGTGVREFIFEDALEVLLAAAPTHDEYGRALKKMRTFDEWEVIDLINNDIKANSDGSPIRPETPPQEVERKQARDFASFVRKAAPYMSQPLTRIDPHSSVWDLRWNPRVLDLEHALRRVVHYAFAQRYFDEPQNVRLAMQIFDSFELGDLIMWINDSKDREGDTTGRLSTQSTVDDLWNKCFIQDLEDLCDALDSKGADWQRIPWPKEDTIGKHRGEMTQFLAQYAGGDVEIISRV